MIIENITYGSNKEKIDFHVPLLDLVVLESAQLAVVKNLLDGTDSDEWLLNAEKKILNG